MRIRDYHKVNVLMFLAVFALTFQYGVSSIWNGFEYRDLISTDPTAFATESLTWTPSALIDSSKMSYTCNGVPIMGGYNILGSSSTQMGASFQRNYATNIPDHAFVRITFTFYALDGWVQSSDYFYFYVDSVQVTKTYLYYSNFGGSDYCGDPPSAPDLINYRWFQVLSHTSPTINLQFISGIGETSDTVSFGVRNVNILFDNNDNIPTNLNCAIAPGSSTYTTCSCTEGYYSNSGTCTKCDTSCASCFLGGNKKCFQCASGYFWSGSACVQCHSACAVCFGTTNTQCLQCAGSNYLFAWNNECSPTCPLPLSPAYDAINSQYICTSPCTSSQFLYFDGTCHSTCPGQLAVQNMHTNIKVCTTPCSPAEFLYWDGTCQHDCGYPLTPSVTTNFRYCLYPCASNQILYWNGSCVNTCSPPYIMRQQNNRSFCNLPCGLLQYLYWDNTCQDTCALPLIASTIPAPVLTCSYPCSTSQYLYFNGSCTSNCPYPLSQRTSNGQWFCDYPTNTNNYLYWDGTSSSTCASPLTQRVEGSNPAATVKYCDYGCSISQFMYWNGTCQLECDIPLVINVTNNRQYCLYPCTAPSQYLYWNGSCLYSCPLPLSTRSEDIYNFCDYPTDSSNFLYWDGSSSSTCASPLVQRIEGSTIPRKFCDFPCNISQYLYWNGSCISTCPGPLSSGIQNGRRFCYLSSNFLYYNGSLLPTCEPPFLQITNGAQNFCKHPCGTSVTYYYYPNSSCSATCNTPWYKQVIGDIKWCIYPCLLNQYLYKDGSCNDLCDPSFTAMAENNYRYCIDTCPSTSFIYYNGSCLSSCPAPFRGVTGTQLTITSRKVCLLPCDNVDEFYNPATQVCSLECDAVSKVYNGIYLQCITTPATVVTSQASAMANSDKSVLDVFLQASQTSETWSFVAPAYIVNHVRYINIPLSQRMAFFTTTNTKPILSIKYGRRMSDDARAWFTMYNLPGAFQGRNLHSSFIVNFWEDLTSALVIFLIVVFLRVAEEIFRIAYQPALSLVARKTGIILRWNLFFMLFGICVNDIVFYSALEFITFQSGGPYDGFSFFLCFMSIIAFTAFLMFILLLLYKRKSILQRTSDDEDLLEFGTKWQRYQITFTGFHDVLTPNELFYLMYVIRHAINALIASYCYNSPQAQSILYILVNGIALGYILWRRPIVNKLNYIQLIIIETLSILINILLAVLAFMAANGQVTSSVIAFIGDMIIFLNAGIYITLIIFLGVKLTKAVKKIRKHEKSQDKSERDRILWAQLLVIFFQQGGFGFEEVYTTPLAAKVFVDWELRAAALAAELRGPIEAKDKLKKRIDSLFPNRSELISEQGTPERMSLFRDVETPSSTEKREVPKTRGSIGSAGKDFVSLQGYFRNKGK